MHWVSSIKFIFTQNKEIFGYIFAVLLALTSIGTHHAGTVLWLDQKVYCSCVCCNLICPVFWGVGEERC